MQCLSELPHCSSGSNLKKRQEKKQSHSGCTYYRTAFFAGLASVYGMDKTVRNIEMKNLTEHFFSYTTFIHKATACCLFLFFCIQQAQAQQSNNPLTAMKTVLEERFHYNTNNWTVGQNEYSKISLHDSKIWFDNLKQEFSSTTLIPNWQYTSNTDFVIKVNFELWKTLSEDTNACGGGFVWGATAPFKNMHLLYFSYNQPKVKYLYWNEKGEFKTLFEKALPEKTLNKNEHFIEIHRKGDNLFFYEYTDNGMQEFFTYPFQPITGNQIGFYADGVVHLKSNLIQISVASTENEKTQSIQKQKEDSLKWVAERPEQFRKWNEIADENKKKLTKYDGKNVYKLAPKERIKYRELQENLAEAYYSMASLKQDEGDIETAVVFYQLSAETDKYRKDYYAANWQIGKIYLSKYHKSGQEEDKLIALDFLLKGAVGEKGTFNERPRLKEYYQLKYPFITNFTFLDPQGAIPQTKEEYDKKYAEHLALQAQTAKLKQQWQTLNQRPKFTALAIVIDNFQPQKSYIANTQKTVPLTQIFAEEIKIGDFYFDPSKNDFIMAFADGKPLDLTTDYVFMNRDYNFQFEYDKHECAVCHGTGFTASGGNYTYQVATGRYTENRSGTIVSQTESITRTPIYETHTIQGTPKYNICKICDGKGGQPPTKRFTITIDGQRKN